MGMADVVRRVINRIFPEETLAKKLGVQITTSSLMEEAIELWRAMYQGVPGWINADNCTDTLNLPAAIAEEVARLILTEFEFGVDGGLRGEFITEQMRHFLSTLKGTVELWAAMGGIVLKPYVASGAGTDELDRVNIDVIMANRFYPTAYDSNREITAAVFVDTKHIGDYLYTRLEYHSLEGTTYTVKNRAFRSEKIYDQTPEDEYLSVNRPFQDEVSLNSVDAWSGLEPEVVLEGIERPLFVYVRVPRANSIDPSSPLGVSVYSRATGIIRQADRQFSRIMWEYEAKEPALDVDVSLFDFDRKGNPVLPEGRERIYRTYEFEAGDKPGFFDVYSPEIRDSSLFNGLNELMRKIEFLCGLAYGTLSDPGDVAKTATEIRMSKQRSYATVSEMQTAWSVGLENLVYVMDTYCTLYGLAPTGEVEVSCTWGDGVLEDTEAEFQRRWNMVLAGKLKTEKFYEWYFGCTEDEAKEMIPTEGRIYPPVE